MKLRVRINTQTIRLELDGVEPTLAELRIRIRETLLASCILQSDVEFSLTLNGFEALVDTGQTLCSCGVVSGDMIRVLLPQKAQEELPKPSGSGVQNTSSATAVEEAGPSSRAQSLEAGGAGSGAAVDEDSESEESKGGPAPPPPPLLCCEAVEGSIPDALERLLHSSGCRKPAEGLMLAAHLLLLETGFTPQGGHVISGEMPVGWRAAGGVFKLQYAHTLLESSLVSVIAMPMGATLVVNAVLKMGGVMESSRKLVLKPDDYVTLSQEEPGALVVYRDLRRLSRLFKDQLVYPLMASAREALGLPALFGLVVLPPELMLRVLRLLDVSSLVSLSAVCRELNSITHDPSLWRHLLHRDFRTGDVPEDERSGTDWRQVYKRTFKHRKMLKRRRRVFCHPSAPPLHPLIPFVPPPAPPLFPPGIIGGDYDQTPLLWPRPQFHPLSALRAPIGRGGRAAEVRRGFI